MIWTAPDRAWTTLVMDPQVDELEAQSRRLGEALRGLEPDEKEKRTELRKKLEAALDQLFERREKGRWKELEELDGRMKEMRKTLETRKQNKPRIIEKRVRELSGEKDDMDW